MVSKYVLQKTADGQYLFHLTVANGEIILTGERYIQKSSAEIGIVAVRLSSPLEVRYVRKSSPGGKHFFVLTAANGAIIGTSEPYGTAAAMEEGISSVMEKGPNALIEDLT